MIWKKEKMVRIGLNKTNFFFFLCYLELWFFFMSVGVVLFFLFVFCLFGRKFFYTVDGCFFFNLLFV